MKRIFKTLTSLALIAMLSFMPSSVSAQRLLVTLKNHTTVSVKVDKSFCISFEGDNVQLSDADGVQTVPQGDIASITIGGNYGDLSQDGEIDVADIAVLIDLMAGIGMEDLPREEIMAVDLALPSGRQWASMNVGATKENGHGLYFAWGDTEGYGDSADDGHVFDWTTYKWMPEGETDFEKISKYQYPSNTAGLWFDENGVFVGDGMNTLLAEDDAATVAWGRDWRMPTAYEVKELIENTQQDWIQVQGVWGCKFTGTNGNFIFLPASGDREGDIVAYVNEKTGLPFGRYWTKNLFELKPWYATSFSLEKDVEAGDGLATVVIEYPLRTLGLCIRPVYDKK